MEFDKSKVYSMVNADEVKVGSTGLVANNMTELKNKVSRNSFFFTKISNIKDESHTSRFADEDSNEYPLFYLLKEPQEKKFRPYSNPDEMIEDFKKRYNAYGGWSGKDNPMYNPMIWIKSKTTGFRHLVTDYDDPCNKSCIRIGPFSLELKELFDKYTYLDGTPCGIMEGE